MYFLWQVEIEPFSKEGWVQQIGNHFGIRSLKEKNFEIENDSDFEVRNWFLTVYKALGKIREEEGFNINIGEINGHKVNIVDIMARFSRYEQKSLLLLLLDYDIGENLTHEIISGAQSKIKELLEKKYKGIVKSEFSVTIKIEKYEEKITIQNPVPIILDSKGSDQLDNTWKKVTACEHEKFYRIKYKEKKSKNKKDEFIRQLEIMYFIDKEKIKFDTIDDKNRSLFFDRIHTEFMFFIRGEKLEEDFQPTYNKIKFLNKVIDSFEDKWIKVRTLFSVIRKFSIFNKSKGSKMFFNLLEVNAQITSLLAKIKFDVERKKDYYNEAFERLHFSIEKDGTDSEKTYYRNLNKIIYQGFDSYQNKLEMLNTSSDILSDNIQQLRADFDSNTNVALQWLMFLLSIVLIIWGAVTILYDKWVLPLDIAINNPLELIVGGLVATVGGIVLLYLVVAGIWINNISNPMERNLRNMIKNWLNDNEEDNKELTDKLIKEHITKYNQRQTFEEGIIECFELYYLLISGVALDKISGESGIDMMYRMDDEGQ